MHDNHKGIDRQNRTFNQINESNAKVTLKILFSLLHCVMSFTSYPCLWRVLWMSLSYGWVLVGSSAVG